MLYGIKDGSKLEVLAELVGNRDDGHKIKITNSYN